MGRKLNHALVNLEVARKEWTERRRQIAATLASRSPEAPGSITISDEFLRAQAMIEAIQHAMEDEQKFAAARKVRSDRIADVPPELDPFNLERHV